MLRDAVFGQLLGRLFRVGAEPRVHRLVQHFCELVAAEIPFGDERLDVPANLQQAITDVGRVLAGELDDLHRIYRAAMRADVLATGSRDLATSTLVRRESRVREMLGRAYNRLVQATVAPGIVDTQCGAKVARRSVWERILPWCGESGYAWDAEAIAVALALGVPVQEVPIA